MAGAKPSTPRASSSVFIISEFDRLHSTFGDVLSSSSYMRIFFQLHCHRTQFRSHLRRMPSQDCISQYTQGMPATQPERSQSRTPRRKVSWSTPAIDSLAPRWTNNRQQVMTRMTQHTSLMSPMPSWSSTSTTSIVRTVYTYTLPHNFTEISTAIDSQSQSRLPDPTTRDSPNDQLKARRGFSRYYQDQWIRLSVYNSPQQIQPIQGHRRYGPITSPAMEVLWKF